MLEGARGEDLAIRVVAAPRGGQDEPEPLALVPIEVPAPVATSALTWLHHRAIASKVYRSSS
jgi:hypothetical protein